VRIVRRDLCGDVDGFAQLLGFWDIRCCDGGSAVLGVWIGLRGSGG